MTAAAAGLMPVGSAAPGFSLPPVRLREGRADDPVALPDMSAPGLTLIVFFKNTCPTCRLAMPFIQRLHERTAPHGARVVAVSQDGLEGASSFAREVGLTMPVLVDGPGYPVSELYGLVSVPTLYLIRPDGVIERAGVGFDREGLETMAADLAASVGAPAGPLFESDDAVPDFKPG